MPSNTRNTIPAKYLLLREYSSGPDMKYLPLFLKHSEETGDVFYININQVDSLKNGIKPKNLDIYRELKVIYRKDSMGIAGVKTEKVKDITSILNRLILELQRLGGRR